ncbi:MAG: DUF4248 domain-containing protein [Porphyromonas sp.]|nr:DUF4248 domain-containing protein [Porphyromonas sp.]
MSIKNIELPNDYNCTLQVRWVAQRYMPTIQPESASRWLRREIHRNAELAEQLKSLGWASRNHNFNPRQLRALVTHLGPFW